MRPGDRSVEPRDESKLHIPLEVSVEDFDTIVEVAKKMGDRPGPLMDRIVHAWCVEVRELKRQERQRTYVDYAGREQVEGDVR